jgi:chaperone required for assembly of F1-ATPase
MSPELQVQLYNKYPKIFADKDKSMQETAMCWGIETPDDWYDIIDTLCRALTYTYSTSLDIDEEDAERLNIKPIRFRDEDCCIYNVECPQVIAEQVKEKYGTLRFYYRLEYNDDIKYLFGTKKYPQLETILNNFDSYINGIVRYAEVATERKNEQKTDSYYN